MPASTSENDIALGPVNVNVVSSAMVTDAGAVITGASFWSPTVMLSVAVAVAPCTSCTT